jgi:Family of unknown function (DUF6496)
MPDEETLERAHEDEAQGKAPSTQAGEFVREEIEHVREGKHGARSTKQAIAIGLSKARRAGVKLPPPDPAKTSASTRRKALSDSRKSRRPRKTSAKRSRATLSALKKEGRQAASSKALSRQAKASAMKRSRKQRSAAGKKAAKTRARTR